MSCELSPSAHAFSTVLTAFISSVLNGLFNGALVAFFTGWIAWLSALRVILSALSAFYLAFKAGGDYDAVESDRLEAIAMHDLEGPKQQQQSEDTAELLSSRGPGVTGRPGRRARAPNWMTKPPKRDVKLGGWLGWAWSAIYTPASQTIWVAVNVGQGDGLIKIVRAIAIGVSALGLAIDTKHRYGAALGRRLGAWAFVAFNLWNATMCLMLGAYAMLLLVQGAIQAQVGLPIFIVYPIFLCIWAFGSWMKLPTIDGARPGVNVFVDVLAGAFAGIFVAAPAFALWQNAQFGVTVDQMTGKSPPEGMDLGTYLSCEGASIWEKIAAVMP